MKSRKTRKNEELLRRQLGQLLADRDMPAVVATALAAVASGDVDIPRLYLHVLAPLLAETGALWQEGRTEVWEEHLATATVRTIVEVLYPQVQRLRPSAPGRGAALLACPPEEAHDLGLRMLADLMQLAGWTTFFMGAGTPQDDLVGAARALGVGLVVLSASTHYNLLRLGRIVDLLKRELPGIEVLAGGAAFGEGAVAHRPFGSIPGLGELIGEAEGLDELVGEPEGLGENA